MIVDNLFKRLFYYFFTSGLTIAIILLFLETIAYKYNMVNFFAFASAGIFIFNLMQFNVINRENPSANRGFLIHTFFGLGLWSILAILMFLLNEYKFNIEQINIIIILTLIFGFVSYFTAYYYGYFKFIDKK